MKKLLCLTLMLAWPAFSKIIFMDSFDHYAAVDANQKWNSASGDFLIQGTTVRNGIQALNTGTTTQMLKLFPSAQGTMIVGLGFYTSCFASSDSVLVQFRDGGSNQLAIETFDAGGFSASRGGAGTVIAQSALGLIHTNEWNYLEMKVVIAPAAGGSVVLRLNGGTILNMGGLNTSATGSSTVDRLILTSSTGCGFVDDVYIADTTTAFNNDFLGDVKVVALMPSADCSPLQWTPNSGMTHFNRVNEIPEDGDTTYVSTSTVGNVDLFTVPALTGTAPLAHQLTNVVREDAAGARAIGNVVKSGATTQVSADFFLPTTYAYNLIQGDTDPNTSMAWTLGNFNSACWGVKLTQ